MSVSPEGTLCYTDDWKRTRPDYSVYLPASPAGEDGYNDHFLVASTPDHALLAIWTQGSREAASDLRVLYSRSTDGGKQWSVPEVIADDGGARGLVACFGFPVISRVGRIYCFYNKNIGPVDSHYFSGVLRCSYSDNDGVTWKSGSVDIPYRRNRFAHPDANVPCACIVWQKPIRDSQGRWIVGFSRWTSQQVRPKPEAGFHLDSSSELIRFDNIDEGPEPGDLRLTWLPEGEDPIRVSCPIEPEHSRGYSLCEEPSVVLLPDGRLLLVMRTVTGHVWYTVSEDDGASWRPASVLRFSDNGDPVPHPKSPCPLYQLGDGQYMLLFHNHDGFSYGAHGPWDMNARRPLSMAKGEFRPGMEQPLWFSRPELLFDTHGVGVGPEARIWLAMYSSVTGSGDGRTLWYPDRKHFLLGRRVPDTLLSTLVVPKA